MNVPQLLLFFLFRKAAPKLAKPSSKKLNPWDEANLLQNMKQENVHITTVAQQRYVYRESAAGAESTRHFVASTWSKLTMLAGLIAHSELKK
jgi:hypothetical protein